MKRENSDGFQSMFIVQDGAHHVHCGVQVQTCYTEALGRFQGARDARGVRGGSWERGE